MSELEFNEQRIVFQAELSKVFDYVDMVEIYEARSRESHAGYIIDEDMWIFMNFASYAGSLMRISYYKYVYKKGFDVRALADASVIVYMFQGVYKFNLEPYINKKEVKAALNKTRYPKWTRLGLIGGSTKELIDLGKEFGVYMDGFLNG
ncbi:hypothetical protein [Alkalihalobacillus trypoxylicola]|uniref:Uncharacterized protein n=1 Tax=Alkalihalobacillus trypoxylicola TaxID=519424 RepID=A0A161PZJ3_9BACI|nr:hypothetical protein [Alkalihalobacillus trypoxylicola]KYG28155.1 hypothetical protein AZF04_09635 [Alkalihalobacillus trypoxylicola]